MQPLLSERRRSSSIRDGRAVSSLTIDMLFDFRVLWLCHSNRRDGEAPWFTNMQLLTLVNDAFCFFWSDSVFIPGMMCVKTL